MKNQSYMSNILDKMGDSATREILVKKGASVGPSSCIGRSYMASEIIDIMNEIHDGLTDDDCHKLVKNCEYAFEAVNTDENPINWGDSEAFFREGICWFGKSIIERMRGEK